MPIIFRSLAAFFSTLGCQRRQKRQFDLNGDSRLNIATGEAHDLKLSKDLKILLCCVCSSRVKHRCSNSFVD